MATKELDRWQLLLVEKKSVLQECQKRYGIDSCLKCEKISDCSIQEEYVKAVYDSMNKGKGGGFEF